MSHPKVFFENVFRIRSIHLLMPGVWGSLKESGDTQLPCLQVKVGSGRKSIFAQKMAARRAAEKPATAPSAECTQIASASLDVLNPEGSAEEAPEANSSNGDSKWRRFCLCSLLYFHSFSNLHYCT